MDNVNNGPSHHHEKCILTVKLWLNMHVYRGLHWYNCSWEDSYDVIIELILIKI